MGMFNCAEENLIVNIEQLNKDKVKLQIGAIIELFPPDELGPERRKYVPKRHPFYVILRLLFFVCFWAGTICFWKSNPFLQTFKQEACENTSIHPKRYYVCLCLPCGIATPLSINADLASDFRLHGLRDVCIRVVNSAYIELDLVELTIKVS